MQLVDFPIYWNKVFLPEYTCQPLPGISDHKIVLIKSAVDFKPILSLLLALIGNVASNNILAKM